MAGRGTNNGATLGFEQTLWQAADKMRGHMDCMCAGSRVYLLFLGGIDA